MKQGIVKKNIPTSKERIKKTDLNPLLRFHSLFQNRLRVPARIHVPHRFKDPISRINAALPNHQHKANKLRENEEIFQATFNQAAIGIAHVDLKGRFIRVNNKFCTITGWSQKELLTKSIFDITVKEDIRKDRQYFKALSSSKILSHTLEKRYIRKNGFATWVRVTRSFVTDVHGRKRFIVTIVEDINDEIKLHTALELLSETGKILPTSLDFNETINSISKIVIPQLADICIVDVLDENNMFKRVKVAHRNPKDKSINDIYTKLAPTSKKKTIIEHTIATKKSLLLKNLTLSALRKYARNEEHFTIVKEMGVKSIMSVPLISHDQVVGVLTFLSTNEYRHYTNVDLILAEQFATRATIAIENAKLYQKANDAILQRDEFLSIASHELKNPLTSIKGFVQIVMKKLDTLVDDSSKSMLYQVEDQIDRINRLISDLLDFTSIRADRLVIEQQPLDLNVIIANTVALCQQLTDKHQITLKGKVQSKVYADKHRINQVVSNLIANAIKYSPDHKKIFVELHQIESEAIIRVRDHGLGISKKMQKHIFERYFRSEATKNKRISGLGLGLFIASELVKKHNGRIWVESLPNKGSSFYVALPLYKNTDNSKIIQAQKQPKATYTS